MVYLDAEGNQRYTKGVDEKLVARQRRGASPGKAMYIEGGRHSGFFCTVRRLIMGSMLMASPSMILIKARTKARTSAKSMVFLLVRKHAVAWEGAPLARQCALHSASIKERAGKPTAATSHKCGADQPVKARTGAGSGAGGCWPFSDRNGASAAQRHDRHRALLGPDRD